MIKRLNASARTARLALEGWFADLLNQLVETWLSRGTATEDEEEN